jgi:hypothetical protein
MGGRDDDLVQAWWNGRWRLARRDVHLKFRPARWVVEAREGGSIGAAGTGTRKEPKYVALQVVIDKMNDLFGAESFTASQLDL